MAAANASPVHLGRNHGQAQQRIQTSGGVNASSGQHPWSNVPRSNVPRHLPGPNNGTVMPGYRNMDPYEAEDIDMYSPNRTNLPGQQFQQISPENHKLTQRRSTKRSQSPNSDENYETHHLRVQLGGLGVLQELLEDQRQEIKDLQECLESLVKVTEENGVFVDPALLDKLDKVRVGSVTLSEAQWSVELKRPPQLSMLTQADGRDQVRKLFSFFFFTFCY